MKKALLIHGPDIPSAPLALLSGTFVEKLHKAANLGYDGIELMVRDPLVLDWQDMYAQILQAGLTVPQIVTGELYGADGLCLATADENVYRRAEERIHHIIDMASSFNAMVNIGRFRGQLGFLKGYDNPRAVAVERLRKVIQYARVKNVRMTIEPINRYETDFIHNAHEGLELLDEIGLSNCGLMLDLFHMNIEDPSIENGLQNSGEHLWHVHIADSNRYFPGSGHLNFDTILGALEQMHYKHFISAEILPIPDAETCAQKTIQFLNVWEGSR